MTAQVWANATAEVGPDHLADTTAVHGIPDTAALLADVAARALLTDPRFTDARAPLPASVTDASVAAGAAIAEAKLALASDAAAGTASRRSLGTGAAQAVPGDRLQVRVTVAGVAPAAPAVGDVWIDTSI